MCIVYLLPGFASSIALIIYTGLTLVLLNAFNITLTLPGIAGIVLSIGMAVDANVIIFARVREELAAGRAVKSALRIGFQKALSAIIDGNITTLIAALVLGLKGTGSVKGFAQTLPRKESSLLCYLRSDHPRRTWNHGIPCSKRAGGI